MESIIVVYTALLTQEFGSRMFRHQHSEYFKTSWRVF